MWTSPQHKHIPDLTAVAPTHTFLQAVWPWQFCYLQLESTKCFCLFSLYAGARSLLSSQPFLVSFLMTALSLVPFSGAPSTAAVVRLTLRRPQGGHGHGDAKVPRKSWRAVVREGTRGPGAGRKPRERRRRAVFVGAQGRYETTDVAEKQVDCQVWRTAPSSAYTRLKMLNADRTIGYKCSVQRYCLCLE